jgi:hypothetical protein
MQTHWRIRYSAKKFLGGFDGEFRYADPIEGEAWCTTTDGKKPTDEQARAAVRHSLLGDRTADIEISGISRAGD